MADAASYESSSSSSSDDTLLISKKHRKKLQQKAKRERERSRATSKPPPPPPPPATPSANPPATPTAAKTDHICGVCEREGGALLVCTGSCVSAFHAACLPPGGGDAAAAENGAWKCPSCAAGTHVCFHCKQRGLAASDASASSSADPSTAAPATPAGEELRAVVKCRALSCGKYYHQDCIAKLPLARIAGARFICPLHTCAACEQSGAKKEPVRCTRCPVAYHTSCLPRTGVVSLPGKRIICPKHEGVAAPAPPLPAVEEKQENKTTTVTTVTTETTTMPVETKQAPALKRVASTEDALSVAASSPRTEDNEDARSDTSASGKKHSKKDKKDKKKKKKKRKKEKKKDKEKSGASSSSHRSSGGGEDEAEREDGAKRKAKSGKAPERRSGDAETGEGDADKEEEKAAATASDDDDGDDDDDDARSVESVEMKSEAPHPMTTTATTGDESAATREPRESVAQTSDVAVAAAKDALVGSHRWVEKDGGEAEAASRVKEETSAEETPRSRRESVEQVETKSSPPLPPSPAASPPRDSFVPAVDETVAANEDAPHEDVAQAIASAPEERAEASTSETHAPAPAGSRSPWRDDQRDTVDATAANDDDVRENLKVQIPDPDANAVGKAGGSDGDEGDDDSGSGSQSTKARRSAAAETAKEKSGGSSRSKKSKKKRKGKGDDGPKRGPGDQDEDDGDVRKDEAKWVQCDECKKWRTVSKEIDLDAMPETWYCKMNSWNKAYASCSVPEEVVEAKKSRPSKRAASMTGGDVTTPVPKKAKLTKQTSAPELPPPDAAVAAVDANFGDKDKTNTKVTKKADKDSKKRKLKLKLKEKYGEVNWVQCENKQCGKWRVVPTNANSLPSVWYCNLNTWAPELANCAAANPPEVEAYLSKSQSKKPSAVRAAKRQKGSDDQVGSAPPPAPGQDAPARPSSKPSKSAKSSTPTAHVGGAAAAGGAAPSGGASASAHGHPGGGDDGRGARAALAGVKSVVLEWAQCEKCEKWRKLPAHIKSSTLPDKWYCSMNHWDPSRASCASAQEEDQEPVYASPLPSSQSYYPMPSQVGGAGSTGTSSRPKRGKLSYSELLYASTGQLRKTYTSESSTLSFEYEGVTYCRDDQYKRSSMYISPFTTNKISGEQIEPQSEATKVKDSAALQQQLQFVAPAMQQLVDRVASVVLSKIDLRREFAVTEIVDSVISDLDANPSGDLSLGVVTSAIAQLVANGEIEKVERSAAATLERPTREGASATTILLGSLSSLTAYYRKVPKRPLKAMKAWKQFASGA